MNKKILVKSMKSAALGTIIFVIFIGMLLALVASAVYYGPILAIPVGIILIFMVLTFIHYDVNSLFNNCK